ncbi:MULTISPECIES: pyridoxamine 5'-phosphate oxidase family protein [unclassified Roseitalea]|uniref:pyridoxamine 5'-phosphate oxidase family protein n=1 Tax=unclassified Roseitalea TaxID=2639107 RepID=UPI00273E30E5|nr:MULTISPECIES: pyridoxamine 5'-phosphate oxidase family protein [unclassified Roseitalea]
MADIQKTRNDPKGQLWEAIEDSHAVMLGSPDHTQHMQPMAPMVARDEEAIWFFTKTDTDLVEAVGDSGGLVHLCVVGKDHDYHACLRGHLTRHMDQAHVDRFWSPMVEAWYEQGKDDPRMTMLRFVPADAEIWASTDSTLKFGWEIARANVSSHEPEVGYKTAITF